MKLKKLRVVLIISLIVTSLLLSGTAYAQDETLPNPGITPDSPFYFFDTLGKNVGLFFAFGPEAKARKALQYAEERLAEAQAMAAKNRFRELERATNGYDKFAAIVTEKAEDARQQGASANISETVALATSKHLNVLDKLQDQVPEKAWEAIARASTASMNGQKNALRALAKVKPERAIEINLATIESRLNRARVKATENVTAEVEEALEDAAELVEIEEEISEIAQGLGIDTTAIDKLIAIATSNRLGVLAGVYEKVPEQARQGIERAMENSLTKYERTVERLKEKNALGEVPEENPVLQRLREEIKERLRLQTPTQASDNTSANVTAQVRVQAEVQERIKELISNLKTETPEPAISGNKTKGREEVTAPGKGRE